MFSFFMLISFPEGGSFIPQALSRFCLFRALKENTISLAFGVRHKRRIGCCLVSWLSKLR